MATYRWWSPGDLNACFALMLDNLVNLAVFASILTGAFGFPAHIVFFKMIPGNTFGVLLGDLIYSFLAFRLARRTGRQDITAMPLGLDTPSTFGMALTVLGPAFLTIQRDLRHAGVDAAAATEQAAHQAWAIGMATLIMMGVFKFAFSFVADWVRRHVPPAGLLGALGGIGLALLGFLPLLEIFKLPAVGLTCLGLVVYTLLARIDLPGRLPGAAVAVAVGMALYYGLGAVGGLGDAPLHVPELEATLALPWPTLAGFQAMGAALPYLPIAIPFALLTIVGGITVTESARVAGDDYRTRDILLTESVCTLVAGICGGVAQSTPFIGHPAYKQMGARAGYTLIAGVVVGLGGMLGAVSFLVALMPLPAVMPILLFVGFEITVQAFHACAPAHAPAVVFAFLPIIANLLLIRQEQLLGRIQGAVSAAADRLGEHTQTVRELIASAAVQADAPLIASLGHGFILTAMMWGSFFALIIDRKLLRAALFVFLTGLMTLFGVVHSAAPAGDLYVPWQASYPPVALHWAAGYFLLAGLLAALSRTAAGRTAVVSSAEPHVV